MKKKEGKYENLTPLERRFCLNLVRGMTKTDAMAHAGSKAKTRQDLSSLAYQYLKKPHVLDYLMELKKQGAERANLEAEEVIHLLREVAKRSMEDGKYSATTKAAELMGNHLGMFKTIQIKEERKPGQSLKNADDDDENGIDNELRKILNIVTKE